MATDANTPTAEELNPELAITLPLSQWRVVAAHLELGTYRAVAEIIAEMMRQADEQFALYTRKQAETESKAATIN